MSFSLDEIQLRVLGCLLEKELTTPEYYPLTLNALVNACNQKSNRNPVMNLGEGQVKEALQGLEALSLAWAKNLKGDRVTKYAHRLSGTLSRTLDFDRRERAVLSVLFLRGSQTPGEIKARTGRMAEFPDLDDVQAVLHSLAEREDGPFVVELPREPGRRESRFAHLFGVAAPAASHESSAPHAADRPARDAQRIDQVESRLGGLEREIEALKDELSKIKQTLGAD